MGIAVGPPQGLTEDQQLRAFCIQLAIQSKAGLTWTTYFDRADQIEARIKG